MQSRFLLPMLFMGVWADMVFAKKLDTTKSLPIPHLRVVTVVVGPLFTVHPSTSKG